MEKPCTKFRKALVTSQGDMHIQQSNVDVRVGTCPAAGTIVSCAEHVKQVARRQKAAVRFEERDHFVVLSTCE